MEIKLGLSDAICEDYMVGRQARQPFDKVVEQESEAGKQVHGNLMGPMATTSLNRK